MKLKDIQFTGFIEQPQTKVLVACRLLKTTKSYIENKNINLAFLVEKVIEELRVEEPLLEEREMIFVKKLQKYVPKEVSQ